VKLLLATRNAGKLRELAALLAGESIELVPLSDRPQIPEIAESGQTFEANAVLKAEHAARASGLWTLGEDSGLEVDALDGRPGVYSARYAGAHGDDAANNAKLVRELARCDDRSARYVCVMALARPDGRIAATTRGVCEGRISLEPRGTSGFGYDPHFIPTVISKTMAELDLSAKAALSHRAQAFRAIHSQIRMHMTESAATAAHQVSAAAPRR
jgi:XTP/dITP diphosphohydrolase